MRRPLIGASSRGVDDSDLDCGDGGIYTLVPTYRDWIAQVSGGVGNYSFAWNNTAATEQINGLAAGNYCVTVTDGNGCTISDCLDLTAPPELVIESISSEAASCFNAEDGSTMVVASGGTGAYTYLWDDANEQISDNAVFLPAGDYTVIVTDASGCQVSATTTVSQPDSLMVGFTVEDVFCNGGEDGSATALPTRWVMVTFSPDASRWCATYFSASVASSVSLP